MRNPPRIGIAFILSLVVASSLSCAATVANRGSAATASATAADEQSIRQIIEHQEHAWNRGDAAAFSRYFAPEGISTNLRGQSFVGYDAFLRQHQVLFGSLFRNTTLQQHIDVLRFPEPGLAVVEVVTALSGMAQTPPGVTLDAKGRLRTRLLEVLTRQGGDWKIVAYHNIDIKPGVVAPEPRGN